MAIENADTKELHARRVANRSGIHGFSGQEQYEVYKQMGGGRVSPRSPEGKTVNIEASDHTKAENN